MDFSLSDEQRELQELARKILGDLATNERLKDVETRDPVFDDELWRELGRANLLGLAIPESHGGLGFGLFELYILLQEIGRAVAPVPACATTLLGALPIARFGSDEQQARWLPQVAAGETILSGALVEPGAGSLADVSTRAERVGGGKQASARAELHGEKSLVPALQLADCVVVPARSGDDVGLYLVDPRAEGATVTPQHTSDRQPHARLVLEGAPGELLVGTGTGSDALRWLVDRATVGLCALQLGVVERGLEMTAEYARERVQFDRPIGSFQAVHQRAADAFIQNEAIRLSFFEAAAMLADERPAEVVEDPVAIAKYWAAEGGQFTSYACQHLHGGIGIDVDYPLHRYFIWAMQLEHALGSASHQIQALGARIAERGIPAPV